MTIASVDFDEVSEFLIHAVDSTGLQYSEEFSIDVLRFEEPPTDIVLQPNSVGLMLRLETLWTYKPLIPTRDRTCF